MAKVTVLMAVFNGEAYLRESIGSLQRQTHADWQLVCVDDASTDGSLALLHELAAADGRIAVVSLPENCGQAHARNVGLRQADGDYVCFLDCDDCLSADALAQAVGAFEANEAADCVLFRVVEVADGEHEYAMKPFDVLDGKKAFRLSLNWDIHGVYMARTALYRRFPYDETCRWFSDDNTTRVHYYMSREVRACSGVYYYRQHPSSVSHAVSVRQFDRLRANESMKRQLLALPDAGNDVLALYENVRWLVLVDCYMFYHVHGRELTRGERQYGLSEMRRVWGSVDRTLLEQRTAVKLGYRPCRWWWLFRCQEWVYFTLRGFLGKNR